jgi:hypothetical protein
VSTIVAWSGDNGLAATVFGSPDEPRRVVELPGSPRTARFSTISLHGVHYVVWRDRSAVRMMRVSAKGALLDAAPVTIANAGRLGPREELSAPALATNGRGVLAAWVDGDVVRAATIAGGKAGTPFAVLSASDQVSGDRAPAAHDVQQFSRCRRHLVAGRRRRARALDGAGSADGLAARPRLQARRRGRSAKP